MIAIREATAADVPSIRDIFREIYGEVYPYPQFYDLDQLTRMVYSEHQLLLVAEDTRTRRVVGTASVILEIGAMADLMGEFGRLAVLPDARNLGIGGRLMEERLRRVRDQLHVGLAEARLVHPFSLRNAEAHGFVPIGLLPLKMQLKDRESLCLLAQYFGDALALRRNHPRVIPEVYPLAHLALGHCGLSCDAIVDEDSPAYSTAEGLRLRELTTEGYATLLRIERGRVKHREVFGPMRLHYGFFKLQARRSQYLLAMDRDRILGAVGWSEDVIDRTLRVFELIALDDPVARFLLASLERTMRDLGIMSAMEIDVSAFAPRLQRTLLELGFLPTAYIPAMVFAEVERLDVIRMTRLFAPPEFGFLHLSPRAQAVADVVLRPFASRHVLPEIERAVSGLPLFHGLDSEQVRRVASACRIARFGTGDRVLEEQGQDSTLYILLQGEVNIRRSDVQRTVGRVGTGECLGEMSLLTGQPHSASAVAAKETVAAILSHHDFQALVRFRPDIGVVMFRNLAIGLGAKLGRTPVSSE